MFTKATKEKSKGRVVLHGPSGSGKTKTALRIMEKLVEPGQRIAVIDTEAGSASKYSEKHDFDVLEINDSFEPKKVIDAFKFAESNGYGGIILDSATSFWKGPRGFLDMVDEEVKKMKARGKTGDSFGSWKIVDPIYQRWIQELWKSKLHIIFTIRSKMTRERDPADNKIKTMGYQPEFRDDFIYIADVEMAIDIDHNMSVGKTRCDTVDGKIFSKEHTDEFSDAFKAWLSTGVDVVGTVPGPSVAKAPVGPTYAEVVTLIEAVTDDSAFKAAVAVCSANKEYFQPEEAEAIRAALKAKQGQLKGAA